MNDLPLSIGVFPPDKRESRFHGFPLFLWTDFKIVHSAMQVAIGGKGLHCFFNNFPSRILFEEMMEILFGTVLSLFEFRRNRRKECCIFRIEICDLPCIFGQQSRIPAFKILLRDGCRCICGCLLWIHGCIVTVHRRRGKPRHATPNTRFTVKPMKKLIAAMPRLIAAISRNRRPKGRRRATDV